jgi:hypothetical protein
LHFLRLGKDQHALDVCVCGENQVRKIAFALSATPHDCVDDISTCAVYQPSPRGVVDPASMPILAQELPIHCLQIVLLLLLLVVLVLLLLLLLALLLLLLLVVVVVVLLLLLLLLLLHLLNTVLLHLLGRLLHFLLLLVSIKAKPYVFRLRQQLMPVLALMDCGLYSRRALERAVLGRRSIHVLLVQHACCIECVRCYLDGQSTFWGSGIDSPLRKSAPRARDKFDLLPWECFAATATAPRARARTVAAAIAATIMAPRARARTATITRGVVRVAVNRDEDLGTTAKFLGNFFAFV